MDHPIRQTETPGGCIWTRPVSYTHLLLASLCLRDCIAQRCNIMAVYTDNVPVKRPELGNIIFQIVQILNIAVELHLVGVHEQRQIVQAAMRRQKNCFPVLSFLHLAIADDDIDAIFVFKQIVAQRNTGRHRKALAQRTGRDVNTGGLGPVTMTGQIGVMLVERFQLLYREEALERQSRVDSRAGMALGAYKPVAAFPLGILRIIFHFRTVQNSQNFYDRHRTAQMAETASDKLFHRLDADLLDVYKRQP